MYGVYTEQARRPSGLPTPEQHGQKVAIRLTHDNDVGLEFIDGGAGKRRRDWQNKEYVST
jgi:hypothetical protein